ncbi:MAG: hypothetical protein DRP08_03535, partial [Candidatus Aenigmatarchaeota archaeon]
MTKFRKVQLLVWIPESLNEKLRSLIQQKYNRYERGLLSYEVEMALRSWIALHTRAQKQLTTERIPNPTPKVQIVFAQVKDWLLRNYYEELVPGQQILTQHLREAIENVRGSDP